MAVREYKDFRIRIDPESTRGEGYPVSVISSPAGESREDIRMFLRPDQSPLLDDLNAFWQGGNSRDRLHKIGVALFESLFVNSATKDGRHVGKIDRLFSQSLADIIKPSKEAHLDYGLRIRLDIQAPDLKNIPWELMIRPDQHALFLSPVPITPIIRHVGEYFDVMPPLQIKLPLNVLLILVNREEPLQLEVTTTNICNALEPLGDKVRVTPLHNPSLRDIITYISREKVHVLHYAGTIVQNSEKEACLSLGDDAENPKLTGELLATYLRGSSVRLVVLNASGTAEEIAPIIIRAGVPVVVAMQTDIEITHAECFAESFYAPVADLFPVEFAVCEARKTLQGEFGIHTGQWSKPVLYMASETGDIFDFAEAKINQKVWSDEELEEIETILARINWNQAQLNTVYRVRNELNEDVRDLLDEKEKIYQQKIRDLKKRLIDMDAMDWLAEFA